MLRVLLSALQTVASFFWRFKDPESRNLAPASLLFHIGCSFTIYLISFTSGREWKNWVVAFNECLMFAFQHFAYVNASNCQLEILEILQPFCGGEIHEEFEMFLPKDTFVLCNIWKVHLGEEKNPLSFQQSKAFCSVITFCPSLFPWFLWLILGRIFTYICQSHVKHLRGKKKQQQGSQTCTRDFVL